MNEINLNQGRKIAQKMLARTVGVELECDGLSRDNIASLMREANERGVDIRWDDESRCYMDSHITRDYWKVTDDGSINGGRPCEVVSPPLMPIDFVNELFILCELFEKYNFCVNRTMGFHVHHDGDGKISKARKLTPKRLKYLVNHFVKNESNFDALVSPSRRSSQWARSNKDELKVLVKPSLRDGRDEDGYYNAHGINQQPNGYSIGRDCRGGARYRKLNIHAFTAHGTIEFRQHQPTLNFTKIVMWTVLTQSIVGRSFQKVNEVENYDDNILNMLLAGKFADHYKGGILPRCEASEYVCEYVCERVVHFGVKAAPTLYKRSEVNA
jgi:hypothetical protein